MSFNNKLYKLRKQKGFSQEELANRLNVSRQTVSKWELGETTPEMEKLIALSELFEMSIDEMVFDRAEEALINNMTESHLTVGDVLDQKILTRNNKENVKKILKVLGIGVGIIFVIDLISLIIYFVVNGFPG